MQRRDFLIGSVAAATTLAIQPARALEQCDSPDFRGLQRCAARLSVWVPRSQQRMGKWCWAACISGIFAYYRVPVDQARIVKAVKQRTVDEGASNAEMTDALTGEWVSDNGREFEAQCEVLIDESFRDVNAIPLARAELADEHPLIIGCGCGAVGHATVLSALIYDQDPDENFVPVSAVVSDPWYGQVRTLSAQEWFNMYYMVGVRVFT